MYFLYFIVFTNTYQKMIKSITINLKCCLRFNNPILFCFQRSHKKVNSFNRHTDTKEEEGG